MSGTKQDLPPPLASLLAKLMDSGLDEQEKAKLEKILRKNPAARDYYRLYIATHLELTEAAPQLAAVPSPSARRTPLLLPIAAAIALVAGLSFYAASRLQSPRRTAAVTIPGPVLAVTTVTQDTLWSLPQSPQAGVKLHAGRVQLTAGSLALAFNGNQIVTLAAPSDFELINENEIFLNHGSASLRVVGSASPYIIRVPRGTVVDLGTEFSVKVTADGTADVWVFEGKALASLTAGGTSPEQQALTAGQSLRIAKTLGPSPAKATDFTRPLLPDSGPTSSRPITIAHFSAEFPTSTLGSGQPFGGTETPASGWSYLWNPTGTLANATTYQPLMPNTVNTFPAANGGGIFPMFTRLGNLRFNANKQGIFQYGRIARTSIHPGKYVKGKDYRAIIAYTIQEGEAGEIRISNSSIAKYRVDGSITNGVDLDIYINDKLVPALSKDGFQSLTATDFNGNLGKLSVGETVYVTLGSNGGNVVDDDEYYDAFDACVIDFQLIKAP